MKGKKEELSVRIWDSVGIAYKYFETTKVPYVSKHLGIFH